MTPSESVDAPQINKRRVGGLVLLDPIACCLYHPSVTSEFVYPQVTGVLQAAEDYFVKKELFAAALISRHLPWHQANVWLEDCSPAVPTLVGLSTDDKIVPSDAVQKVFGSWSARLRHGTRVLRMPGLGHGVKSQPIIARGVGVTQRDLNLLTGTECVELQVYRQVLAVEREGLQLQRLL